MKKTFLLSAPNKSPERLLDSIKFEIKKYIARERRKEVPENYDFWDFDCKIGDNEQNVKSFHIAEINTQISELASKNIDSFYLEILAKPRARTKKKRT
jgi:hypothetical protein